MKRVDCSPMLLESTRTAENAHETVECEIRCQRRMRPRFCGSRIVCEPILRIATRSLPHHYEDEFLIKCRQDEVAAWRSSRPRLYTHHPRLFAVDFSAFMKRQLKHFTTREPQGSSLTLRCLRHTLISVLKSFSTACIN